MKRLFKLLMAFSLLLILTLSAVGCDFLIENGSGGGSPETPPASSGGDGFSVNVDLKDSLVLSETISYPKSTRPKDDKGNEVKYDSWDQVIENTGIYRASVVITVLTETSIINGSGTIIDIDDGVDYGALEDNIFYVLTCHHVIEGMQGRTINVYVPDEENRQFDQLGYDDNFAFTGKIGGEVNRSLEVSLVGGDLESDIALLRLYVSSDSIASKIKKAKVIDENNSVKIAEDVLAIGYAEGKHPNRVSSGIISDLSSSSSVESVGQMTLWGIDVDIYPGNSGGGLFNKYGELVGVTNSGESIVDADEKTTSIGINFAIPFKITDDTATDKGFINVAKQLLSTYSEYNYGYVSGRKEKIGITTSFSNGVVSVSIVNEGGKAALAGVRVNDVIKYAKIKSIGTKVAVNSNSILGDLIRSAKSSDVLILYIARRVNGITTNVEVSIALSQYYFCNTGNYTAVKVS